MREFWIGFFIIMAIGTAAALIYSDWLRGSDDAVVERGRVGAL